MLREYRVIWEIDIEATSPKRAAEQAREIQLDPDNIADCFLVDGKAVDLSKGRK